MSRRDPYLRAAALILRHLAKPGDATDAVDRAAHYLIHAQCTLEQTFRQLYMAQNRGWQLVAGMKRSQLLVEAYEVQKKAAELIGCHTEAACRPPTLADVRADLRQLKDEFETVDFRLKEKVIAVRTDSITLRDVELGPFSIELHLGQLRRRGVSAFVCVALEPNPADCNNDVTHPHVNNKALCPGEATLPLSAALKEGRIADAFCLISAVLHEYNPGSAYVSLDNWKGQGVHCDDCNCLVNSDDAYYCDGCERYCCDNCTGSCAGCAQIFCANCLAEDPEVEESFCSRCRRLCADCGRIVGLKHCDKQTGLCRDCRESREESTPSTQNPQPKEPHEQPEQQSAPAPVAGPG